MKTYRFFASAIKRQLDIWLYTEAKWGEAQANQYIRGLHKKIKQAVHTPSLWKQLPGPAFEGIYFIRYERHYIFFRKLSEGSLGVITLLHNAMDLPSRLREELESF